MVGVEAARLQAWARYSHGGRVLLPSHPQWMGGIMPPVPLFVPSGPPSCPLYASCVSLSPLVPALCLRSYVPTLVLMLVLCPGPCPCLGGHHFCGRWPNYHVHPGDPSLLTPPLLLLASAPFLFSLVYVPLLSASSCTPFPPVPLMYLFRCCPIAIP